MIPDLRRLSGALGCSEETMRWLDRLDGSDTEHENTTATADSAERGQAVIDAIVDPVGAVMIDGPLACW
jgi:hypothetical protein